jgi:quinol monooxygenase YgiN
MSSAIDKLLKFASETNPSIKLEIAKKAMQECEDLFTQLALNSAKEKGALSHENAAIVRSFRKNAIMVVDCLYSRGE